ncbi:WbqC family protein [Parapedobacter tibetensis]|uniref:WbqC family protein n=1 Tax=Parapedobacter tibetensis TaxID=2972951 RepID=UPI00214DCFD2|nr:WbqC family protein [Parapedobacter tibetensis]
MDNYLILPALYLPPISFFSTIRSSSEPILLDRYEHFPKQTYRNRASIYSANGKLDLIIPIRKGRHEHTKMKDVRINDEADWQRLHWMSLQTAYRSSAYFEYYEDDFAVFYQQQHELLFDYNVSQIKLLLRLLKINRQIGYTDSYREDYAPEIDFRKSIHPKKENPGGANKPYYQVFDNKHGFIANLSIVDLLFNHGPQSKGYL